MKRYTIRQLAPDDERHGTDNGYTNCGCRCNSIGQLLAGDFR